MTKHVSVLLQESISSLNLKENSISGAPFGAVKGMKVIKWQE